MIRLALVGYGWMGAQHVAALTASPSDTVRITTVVVRNPDKTRGDAPSDVEFVSDYGQVLKDPAIDAVLLATPHSLHTDQALRAIEGGKHVYLEKPFALTRAAAQQIVDAAGAAGVVLGLGHNHRLNPNRQAVKELVGGLGLGTLTHVEGNISHDLFAGAVPPEWRAAYADAPTGGLVHMGAHFIDAYIDMFGDISSVSVFASGPVEDAAFEFAPTNSVLFKFQSGMTGYLGSALLGPRNARFQVFGTTGWVEERGEGEVTQARLDGDPMTHTYPRINTGRALVEAFAEAAAGGAAFPISTDQMIHNAAVLEAMTRSLETGGTVTVER